MSTVGLYGSKLNAMVRTPGGCYGKAKITPIYLLVAFFVIWMICYKLYILAKISEDHYTVGPYNSTM